MTLGRPSFGDLGPNRESYHQAPLPVQAVAGIARTARHFPLGYGMGNLFQLGGEFVLGPGYRCEFAHRMRYFGGEYWEMGTRRNGLLDPEIGRVESAAQTRATYLPKSEPRQPLHRKSSTMGHYGEY